MNKDGKNIEIVRDEGPVTQKKLAAALGMSQATVSRAMRNDRRIPETTRRRVLDKAEKMGYRPAPLISAWASKAHSRAEEMRNCPLAFISCEDSKNTQDILYLTKLKPQAYARGFKVQYVNSLNHRDGAALSKTLFRQGVQGIFLGHHVPPVEWFEDFDFQRFAAVSFSYSTESLFIPQFRASIAKAIMQLYSTMWKKGYRRIGFVWFCHQPGILDDGVRLGAFMGAQSIYMETVDTKAVYRFTRGPWDDVTPPFYEWLDRYKPDALMGFNVLQHYFLTQGPERFQNIPIAVQHMIGSKYEDEKLAGMMEDIEEVIKQALQWLENAIRLRQYGKQARYMCMEVQSSFKDGPSLPPVPKCATPS